MLFKINSRSEALESVQSNWVPKELELERYLVSREEGDAPLMSASVFGEPLLLVKNQVQTRGSKRADLLALDRSGNGVVIELKRDVGRLGVETQALQYLADFSSCRGEDFLRRFCLPQQLKQETVLGFLGGNVRVQQINRHTRIILVARSFDEAVFSLGEWLSSKDVAFRCISYLPVELNGQKLLSFSVAFDRSPASIFPLSFGPVAREPGYFWHNIAAPDEAWWHFLVSHNQIPACFEDSPGDQGERLLGKYVRGDRVIAYAKGYGAVGWGTVEGPDTYRLVAVGGGDDALKGKCRHRISVKWRAIAPRLAEGISAEEVRREFNIYHPISTSVSLSAGDGERLCQRLSERFGALR